jgi:hypothetical protein
MSEPHQGFHVWIAWDNEASVWYVRDSDLPGLVAEGETVDALRDKLLPRVRELVELNQHLLSQRAEGEVPLHLHAERTETVLVSG